MDDRDLLDTSQGFELCFSVWLRGIMYIQVNLQCHLFVVSEKKLSYIYRLKVLFYPITLRLEEMVFSPRKQFSFKNFRVKTNNLIKYVRRPS